MIRDIVVDPDNYRTVFVTDGSGVWRSDNAGEDWVLISEGLENSSTASLEIFKPDSGTIVLLVGGINGVSRSVNPDENAVWTRVGRGLPNTLVTDMVLSQSDQRGGVLVAGTLGRGAWSIAGDAADQLAQESLITINAGVGFTDFTIRRNPDNATLLQILANGNLIYSACQYR